MVLLTFNWKNKKKEAHTTDLDQNGKHILICGPNMANKNDFSTPNVLLDTQKDRNRRKRWVINILDEWLIITKRQISCSELIT